MSGNLTNLERVIAKNPTSSLFARLADAYRMQGDSHRAIEICRQGLRYRPSYVSGHVVLGKSHFEAGTFEEARRAFNKALHLDPNHAVAIWFLGQIDRAMGWDDLALRNFQKARDLEPLSQTLQEAIEAILASISTQVDQRLREEVREANDTPPDPGLSPAGGQERGKESAEARPEAGRVDEAPAADPPDFDPEKAAIARLLREIRAEGVPGPAPEKRRLEGEPGRTASLPDERAAGNETTEGETSGGADPGEAGLWGRGSGTAITDARLEEDAPERVASPASGTFLSLLSPAPVNRRGRRSRNGAPPGGEETGAGQGEGDGGASENGPSGRLPREVSPITTATLAEIYAGQGLAAQAIAIFEKVLEREPDNARARERLNALRDQGVEKVSGER